MDTRNDIPAIPEAMREILADPGLLEKVREILGGVKSAEKGDENSANLQDAAQKTGESAPSGIGEILPPGGVVDGITSLLSDPAMAEKLPRVIALLRTTLAKSAAETEEPSHAHPHLNDRDALLLAMKPFLTPERREAVDAIIRISRLGAVLKEIR